MFNTGKGRLPINCDEKFKRPTTFANHLIPYWLNRILQAGFKYCHFFFKVVRLGFCLSLHASS